MNSWLRFGLIGDGIIAERHKKAIKKIGGTVEWIYDPKYKNDEPQPRIYHSHIPMAAWSAVNWAVICSPTYLHRHHVMIALNYGKKLFVKSHYACRGNH